MSKKVVQITPTVGAQVMDSFPANSNPFNHDLFNMGTQLGKDLIIMHGNHDSEDCEYLILCNTKTGERVRIIFGEPQEGAPAQTLIETVMSLKVA